MSPDWPNYDGKAAMIHCSEEDGTSSASGIQQARAAIESAGGSVELFDYPGTQHAFFNDERPEVYDQEASALAWDRTITFLHNRLSG
jgi:carboxymethylenebutenolidase